MWDTFSGTRNDKLKTYYYNELLRIAGPIFNVELLNGLLDKTKNGKAAGLDNITSEHLKYSHPIVITVLCKFNQSINNQSFICET